MRNKQTNILSRSQTRVKTHITSAVLSGAAVLVSGLMLTGVSAQASVQTGEAVNVRIDTRDLVSQRGVERVYEQMSRRADRACSSGNVVTLGDKRASKMCSADLLAAFVQNLDDERISALHRKRIA